MDRLLHIGERFRIGPPGMDEKRDRIDLVMARGAFGSGEHETTASCIECLETLDLKGKSFLDLGCGTGILGIAARKLGARGGLCVDIDPAAVESARRNFGLNRVGDEVALRCGTLDRVSEHGFDIVMANIYGDILLEICDALVEKTLPRGTLLLSGILWEYNYDVRDRYQKAGCRVEKNRLLEEFSTILLTRRH